MIFVILTKYMYVTLKILVILYRGKEHSESLSFLTIFRPNLKLCLFAVHRPTQLKGPD